MRSPFSRSVFLRGALGIATAAVGFAGISRIATSGAAPGAGAAGSASGSGSGSGGGDPTWHELRVRMRGRVLVPGDWHYPAARQVFNTRFDDDLPAAVVQVADEKDVATALAFAAEHGLTVSARAGGHSYAGLSTAPGTLVIDVRRLRGVRTDGQQAVIAPGHNLYEVYRELDGSGRSLPSGSCPGVGLAGLTLGGGLGIESRAYGLTCDRLTAATLVLPDGTVTEVSATSRPELFWGLRGGGPGLGIVTSMTFDTIPATAKDVVRLAFPGDVAERVITGWQDWLRTAARDRWAQVSVDADGSGGLTCWMLLVCPAGTGETVTAELSEAIGLPPAESDSRTLGHLDTVMYLAGGTIEPPRCEFTNGSDIVAALTPEVIGRVLEAVTRFSSVGGTGWVQLNTLDGAVRDLSPTATAFPWRAHAALVEWGAYEPIPRAAAVAWIADAHATLAADTAGAYVNYLEPGDPMSRYFGGNHQRLAELRGRVDPDNRIRSVLRSS
ncbi:FAD-dependent oxidoreductase [Nocardia yamanashiensis]|uniref:FAD-binding oxidoreductase n=1 Tax=Nocardia yamanashiensis TaxID=209247 RepID=UPI001E533765|nr:FAD-dependent oxidoreductase [Nocardia yamanashiensis]UGT40601.1 FAD-dependent oxidoreductase [Nocardia yamanashiensis]